MKQRSPGINRGFSIAQKRNPLVFKYLIHNPFTIKYLQLMHARKSLIPSRAPTHLRPNPFVSKYLPTQPSLNQIFTKGISQLSNCKQTKSPYYRGWGGGVPNVAHNSPLTTHNCLYSNCGSFRMSPAGTSSIAPPAFIQAFNPPSITVVLQFSFSSMCATRLLVVSRRQLQ